MENSREGDSPARDLDWDGGVLTPGQRRFLLEQAEDSSGGNARQTRYRIRQRLKGALRDFAYLKHLPRDDIQQVLDEFRIHSEDKQPSETLIATTSMFELLYTGLGRSHFEENMKRGVWGSLSRREIEERGIYPAVSVDFDVSINQNASIDVEETLRALKEEEGGRVPGWVSLPHYDALVAAGRLDELPEHQQHLLRTKLMARGETNEREQVKEWISEASAGELSTWEMVVDSEELLSAIEERRQEIADQVASHPERWGLNRQLVNVLLETGFFDTGVGGEEALSPEEIAEKYCERYDYVRHLHRCSGVLDVSDRQDRDSLVVTPDMFDPEMEQAHKKRVEKLRVRHRRGERLSKAQYDCLVAEPVEDGGVEYEEIKQEYNDALQAKHDDYLPSEYEAGGPDI